MKIPILTVFTCLFFFCAVAQERVPVAKGTITLSTQQKIKFTNLRYDGDLVVFFNTETKSDFRYFMRNVQRIEDASGIIIFPEDLAGQIIPLTPKPKPEWIKGRDSVYRSNRLRAEIILINGDTLKTHIKVSTNLFDPDLINPLSFVETVKTFEDKEKTKYEPKDIKRLRFIDFKSKERLFVFNGYHALMEILYDGKIRWNRFYYSGQPGEVISADFLIRAADKQSVGLGGFTNRRKKLREITSDRPDLLPMIEKMSINDAEILALLEAYEK